MIVLCGSHAGYHIVCCISLGENKLMNAGMICSNTLQHTLVKDMGLNLDGSVLLPFLYNGVMLAIFQSEGSLPWSNED